MRCAPGFGLLNNNIEGTTTMAYDDQRGRGAAAGSLSTGPQKISAANVGLAGMNDAIDRLTAAMELHGQKTQTLAENLHIVLFDRAEGHRNLAPQTESRIDAMTQRIHALADMAMVLSGATEQIIESIG